MPGWFQKSGSHRAPAGDESEEGSTSQSAKAFQSGLQEHLKARVELLEIEAREAGGAVARKGAFGVAAAFLLLVAYALLLIAAVSLLGRWVESWSASLAGYGWQLTAIAAGLLHALLALILVKKLKGPPAHPLFEYTRAEFHKDRAWLNQPKASDSENKPSP